MYPLSAGFDRSIARRHSKDITPASSTIRKGLEGTTNFEESVVKRWVRNKLTLEVKEAGLRPRKYRTVSHHE
jgi:hypothetical protein